MEALDMDSNLGDSEYQDGDLMEPMDGDYSSADFETGVSDEGMDADIEGQYSEDFSYDFDDEEFDEDDSTLDDSEEYTDESIEEPGQYGSDDTEAAG